MQPLPTAGPQQRTTADRPTDLISGRSLRRHRLHAAESPHLWIASEVACCHRADIPHPNGAPVLACHKREDREGRQKDLNRCIGSRGRRERDEKNCVECHYEKYDLNLRLPPGSYLRGHPPPTLRNLALDFCVFFPKLLLHCNVPSSRVPLGKLDSHRGGG